MVAVAQALRSGVQVAVGAEELSRSAARAQREVVAPVAPADGVERDRAVAGVAAQDCPLAPVCNIKTFRIKRHGFRV